MYFVFWKLEKQIQWLWRWERKQVFVIQVFLHQNQLPNHHLPSACFSRKICFAAWVSRTFAHHRWQGPQVFDHLSLPFPTKRRKTGNGRAGSPGARATLVPVGFMVWLIESPIYITTGRMLRAPFTQTKLHQSMLSILSTRTMTAQTSRTVVYHCRKDLGFKRGMKWGDSMG